MSESENSHKEKRPPGCEGCKKPCTIHITQIMNGKVTKMDMCETCPHAQKMQSPVEFGLMDQLLGMVSNPQTHLPFDTVQKCGHCGYTEAEFKKTGRLGCPRCYEVFILPKIDILKKIHSDIRHKGKVPKNFEIKLLQRDIKEIEKELQELVKKEDYEGAAKLRDKIKELSEQSAQKPAKKKSAAKKTTKKTTKMAKKKSTPRKKPKKEE